MTPEEIDILKKSGKINFKTHKFAKKLIKPGVDLSKVGEKIDNHIKENDAFPAWPVNLSINNEAAHNSYDLEKERILKEDDVLKVDIGVSIDGYITDSAQTYTFSKKNENLKQASDKTLAKAKDYLENNYKTATIGSLGKIIEETIRSFDYKPIVNLTGHYLSRYVAHASPSIPNIANNSTEKFIDYDNQFAVEPFLTTGDGFVAEGAEILIFEHIEDRAIRNKDAKKLLEEIKQFNGLPFSEYWIGKDMSPFSKKFGLRELLKNEIITAYPVLVDKKDSFVSQAETTFLIDKEGLLDLVKVDEL